MCSAVAMDEAALIAHRDELRAQLAKTNRELRRARRTTSGRPSNNPTGLSALVLRCATEQFPKQITPKQVLSFCTAKELETTIHRVNAQLSRLVKQRKLDRVSRGRYVLKP